MNTIKPMNTHRPTVVEDPSKPDMKFDAGKLRFDLITPDVEEQLAAVLTHGAKKYAANSWQENVEDPINRYYAALRRHLNAWRKGEKVDPESGLNHLAHVACNVMFLLHFECPGDKPLVDNIPDEGDK